MTAKKQSGIKLKLFGLILLFFNCICTAAPALEIAIDEHQPVCLADIQNFNIAEADDEQYFAGSYLNARFSKAKKYEKDHSFNAEYPATPLIVGAREFRNRSSVIVRPYYYTYLSLFTLF